MAETFAVKRPLQQSGAPLLAAAGGGTPPDAFEGTGMTRLFPTRGLEVWQETTDSWTLIGPMGSSPAGFIERAGGLLHARAVADGYDVPLGLFVTLHEAVTAIVDATRG